MFYEGDGSNKGMCAAGGAHAANGFNFRLPDLEGIPEVLPFHGNVVTPAGTALGGTVDITLRSDGSYTVNFDMRATGLPSYDFLVRAIFTTPNGLTLVSQYSGHVEGTESGLKPHRENTHTDSGINPLIADNWSDIKNGRLWITKEYAADGLVGFVEDLAKAVLDVGAGAVGGTLGVVIGLGAEIGQVFGHLGVGGAFGLVAGVVVFASRGLAGARCGLRGRSWCGNQRTDKTTTAFGSGS